MQIEILLSKKIVEALQSLYSHSAAPESIKLDITNPEFQGDITLVVFPYLKVSKKKPEETAQQMGEYLKTNCPEIESFNVVKGFLNLIISGAYWLEQFQSIGAIENYGIRNPGKD